MRLTLSIEELYEYVLRLVNNYLPEKTFINYGKLNEFKYSLDRVEKCFTRIHRKYYYQNNEAMFDHMNGDHMAALLYFFSNSVWRNSGEIDLPTKLSYLNKIMHGLDLYYFIEMPDIFYLVHPVGTVLGNAKYNDYLVVYQNVTVGTSTNIYPNFGSGVILYSKTSVIGNCDVGCNVVVSANTLIMDTSIPDWTIVTGQYPNNLYHPNKISTKSRCFE